MKKKSDLIIVILFFLFIYGITFANIVTADKNFSEMENRTLAQKPDLNLKHVLSGEFMEEYETYITDQFVARDLFVGAKSLGERILGKKINNDVYFAKDGYLIEQFKEVDEELLNKNVEAIKNFATKQEADVLLAIIPGSVEINRDKLYSRLPDISQKTVIEQIYNNMDDEHITCVDMYQILQQHKEEDIFYRTDHHWTSLGAYYGYQAISEVVGINPVPLSDYKETVRSEEFYGTLYSKAGAFWVEPDQMVTYVEENGIEVTKIEGDNLEEGELYEESKLDEKDKYAMFLGGNQPLALIENSKGGEQKILIIRDSYSDSLAPFLTAHFGEIYLWDFRYNKESVSAFIKEKEIDRVLICYSVDNFCEDTNIAFVLGRE